MRYAHKILDLMYKSEMNSYKCVLNALVKTLMHNVLNCYSRLPALSILRSHAFRIKNVVQQLTWLISGCTVPILRLQSNLSVFRFLQTKLTSLIDTISKNTVSMSLGC